MAFAQRVKTCELARDLGAFVSIAVKRIQKVWHEDALGLDDTCFEGMPKQDLLTIVMSDTVDRVQAVDPAAWYSQAVLADIEETARDLAGELARHPNVWKDAYARWIADRPKTPEPQITPAQQANVAAVWDGLERIVDRIEEGLQNA